MTEPWLDSLSEDWNSEPRRSSPTSSVAGTNADRPQFSSSPSQSRIPHLAQSMRRDSTGSSFLKPRSTKGIARASVRVLSERSASSLNLPQSSPHDASQKRRSLAPPRRASSAFSESQSSVQHHTVASKSNSEDIPEWKKRLVEGENPVSDGFDLFSPSKLEGMFAEPTSKRVDVNNNQPSYVEGESKPWSALRYSQLPSKEQFSSYRTSRSRAPVMEALHEMNEDDDDDYEFDDDDNDNLAANADLAIDLTTNNRHQNMSAISSDLAQEGSIHGLVRRRVSHLESVPRSASGAVAGSRATSGASRDPRWRTFSGQEEMRNEYISPVTASAQNTIRERAVQGSVDLDPNVLREKLLSTNAKFDRRPSSRSSDYEVSYLGNGRHDDMPTPDGLVPELTSVSLPEDLSMGTQDFEQNGRFVNTRRGGNSSETSFWRKKLSSEANISQLNDNGQSAGKKFRSSPPPYDTTMDELLDRSRFTASLPESYHDDSVVHHSPSPDRPPSGGSPLKLFGNRDTYTNNKLLRVLSQYEQDRSHVSKASIHSDFSAAQQDTGLRMSQFGRGELDTFHFEKEITRPQTAPFPTVDDSEKIFTDFANLSLHGHTTNKSKTIVKPHNLHSDADLEDKQKRVTSSPAKDRSPKRRRTLLKDEIFVDGVGIEIKLDQMSDNLVTAGRKRKDARPGEKGGQADAETLASRSILRPKPGSRKSSGASQARSVSPESAEAVIMPSGELASALAAELATFAQGASAAKQDSRKPSLATKDYMEEANKVMEFIRARGKPKSHLPGIVEPSELDPDSILDVDLDDDSTRESFSRPPSRERYSKPWEDRRIAKHDPHVASQLKKYQEPDDLDLLASTSAIGTFKLVDNRAADEAALVPVPGEDQESSPPNIRILNSDVSSKSQRRSSLGGAEHYTGQSLPSSTRRTCASGSSNSSGHKGVISSGTVSIPENVGAMTFDREKQMWVKQRLALQKALRKEAEHTPRSNRELTLEDDPFEDIPDLSVDEFQEATMRKEPQTMSRPSTAETNQDKEVPRNFENEEVPTKSDDEHSVQSSPTSPSTSQIDHEDVGVHKNTDHEPLETRDSNATQAATHEKKLYNGVPSEPPKLAGMAGKQARVVTIAFSSPIASAIPYREPESMPDDELDDEHFLPPDDSDYEDYIPTPQPARVQREEQPLLNKGTSRQTETKSTNNHAVFRIDEQDEDLIGHDGNSLVHVRDMAESTPRAESYRTTSHPPSAYKGTSMLCLTPLSEFTMHQAERTKHPEESFVAARPHPKALLQAHGALALSRDEMIRAITDATPNEPFWEQLRRLDVSNKSLTSLDGMNEFCPVLEELKLDANQISQLGGLPSSLRRLDVSMNQINDFTSWSHLENLQYIDVSGNALDCLEGFSSLIHLRKLTARGNQLRDIEGVLDLDGLISLDLSGNQLTSIDFEGVDLPRLEELDLSQNHLTHVQNLQCLPRLKRLILDGNKLKELRVSSALTSLQELSLSHNEVEILDLNQFPMIEVLNVDDNCVRSIEGLSAAGRLQKLSVREQRHSFDIVNTILSTHNECSEIMLSSNVLTDGQISLPKYPHYNLRYLELAGCGLKDLPNRFGDYHPNVRDLNLNFNAVQELHPLLGCIKLQHLALAGNRIKRLRRTCLTLSRLPALQKLDIRDNPLTVGFYCPRSANTKQQEQHVLSRRSSQPDEKWLSRLDETTTLRRRTIELLLAERCKQLNDLDGAAFDAECVLRPDTAWTKLMAKGVLMKAIEAPPVVSNTETEGPSVPHHDLKEANADAISVGVSTGKHDLLVV